MKIRTRTAKLLMGAGNLLSFIKTPQRTYEWVGDPSPDLTDEEWAAAHHFKRDGIMWLPCQLSVNLMLLAERLDWEHFPHWALQHQASVCHGTRCESCGGHIHPTPNLNEEVTPS